MPRHRLLSDAELRQLFGIRADREALACQFTPTPSDHDLVLTRRGDANRLGFAVQLALLRLIVFAAETGMRQVTIHAAKTNLSKLIEAALGGEALVIANGCKPVVRLIPLARSPFKIGVL